ncbi:F-box protein [Quillaja saponaria]|uniref:F-box protein n=1 Tax=Quillaja saponaria TaxID=32244 RepID=A0AAD7L9J1_QUISA|nr:F-box protein [Quillaja saponaria]
MSTLITESKSRKELRDMMKRRKALELPNEIIFFNILPRLPPKSLLRFRCVCKSWDSLIRKPSFIKFHQTTRASNHTHFLIPCQDSKTSKLHIFSAPLDKQQLHLTPPTHILTLPEPRSLRLDRRGFPKMPEPESFFKLQSLKGLHCITYRGRGALNPVYIFNANTRQLTTLPVVLAINDRPSRSVAFTTYSFHFGFDPLKDEFKVLCVITILYFKIGLRINFKVFTLGANEWREVIPMTLSDVENCCFQDSGVCVSGALHWRHRSDKIIVAFDVGDEQFRSIPVPDGYENSDIPIADFVFDFQHLIELGGCLTLIGDKYLVNENIMELWVLKDYQNQVWAKDSIRFPFNWTSPRPLPICEISSDEILFLPKCSKDSMSVFYYDSKAEHFRSVKIMEMPQWLNLNCSQFLQAQVYQENMRFLQ